MKILHGANHPLYYLLVAHVLNRLPIHIIEQKLPVFLRAASLLIRIFNTVTFAEVLHILLGKGCFLLPHIFFPLFTLLDDFFLELVLHNTGVFKHGGWLNAAGGHVQVGLVVHGLRNSHQSFELLSQF